MANEWTSWDVAAGKGLTAPKVARKLAAAAAAGLAPRKMKVCPLLARLAEHAHLGEARPISSAVTPAGQVSTMWEVSEGAGQDIRGEVCSEENAQELLNSASPRRISTSGAEGGKSLAALVGQPRLAAPAEKDWRWMFRLRLAVKGPKRTSQTPTAWRASDIAMDGDTAAQ